MISIPTLDIQQEGYVFVYLSYDNDSPNWVYFDDFKVTHTPTNVIQYNEYYPFGLQTSNSWTRDGSSNNYLYNEGNELNPTTGWYGMFFRDYDPALGRMLQVDPYAFDYVSKTPYNYTFNSPVLLSDPSGGSTPEIRQLWMELMTTDFTPWMPGNGVFGHRGPGSGQHWSDQNSTPYRDYFLMGGNNFEVKYGVHASDVGFRNGQIGYYTPSNGGVYGGYTIDNEGVRNFNNAVEVGFTFVPFQNAGGCPPGVNCDDGPYIRNLPRNAQSTQTGSNGLPGSTIAGGFFSLTVATGKTAYKEILRQNAINNSLRKPGARLDPPPKVPGMIKFVAKYGGYGFGAYDFGVTINDYRKDQISGTQAGVQGANAIIGSIPYMGIGTAWTIGWNAGVYFGPSHWYGSDNTKWFK